MIVLSLTIKFSYLPAMSSLLRCYDKARANKFNYTVYQSIMQNSSINNFKTYLLFFTKFSLENFLNLDVLFVGVIFHYLRLLSFYWICEIMGACIAKKLSFYN